jgi:hypothetical protein
MLHFGFDLERRAGLHGSKNRGNRKEENCKYRNSSHVIKLQNHLENRPFQQFLLKGTHIYACFRQILQRRGSKKAAATRQKAGFTG